MADYYEAYIWFLARQIKHDEPMTWEMAFERARQAVSRG